MNYRLAPETRFPGPLHDAVFAYFRLVDDLHVPPENIVVAGDSAGGGLTLALLMYLRDNDYPLPAGAILMSPWVGKFGIATSSAPTTHNSDDRSHHELRVLGKQCSVRHCSHAPTRRPSKPDSLLPRRAYGEVPNTSLRQPTVWRLQGIAAITHPSRRGRGAPRRNHAPCAQGHSSRCRSTT